MIYFWPLAAYLIGSVPMAIVVARAFRLPDPRTVGSHNPGTTNILRYGGKAAAAATLIGDVAKGLVAMAVATTVLGNPWAIAASALAVFLGHLYPLYFGFRGGKGVATALGAWLVLAPAVGALLFATWVVVALLFRYSSLAAMVAACAAPLYALWLAPHPANLVLAVVMAALILWRHRANIRNLIAGTEGRIGASVRSAADR